MKTFTICTGAILLTLIVLPAGCPQQATNNSNSSTQVSASEAAAIGAAINSIESLTGSLNTTQDAAGGDSQSARTTSACPEATFTASNTDGLALNATLDFGDGCDVLGSPDYSCSGSVAGTFTQSTNSLFAQFGALTCNGHTIEGTLTVGFNATTDSIGFTGDWNIIYGDADGDVTTIGNGDATYDRTAATTTFSTFEGEITTGGATYGVGATNVVTSLSNNGNFVPQAGAVTLTGPTFDSVVVHFDSTSPATGAVQVSVNGGDFFSYNLFEQ